MTSPLSGHRVEVGVGDGLMVGGVGLLRNFFEDLINYILYSLRKFI